MDDRHARHRRRPADRRRRPDDGFRTSSRHRFDRLVEDAVASLPPAVLRHLDDVRIAVKEVPAVTVSPRGAPLGLYCEAPRARRPVATDDGIDATADHIVLFRRPLEARAASRDGLCELIRITVVDQLAQHLDIDGDGLDELDWP